MWLTEQVTSYIDQQRQTYSRIAFPLATEQKSVMQRFFSQGTLDRARVTVLNYPVPNPPFYPALVSMGFSQTLLPDFSAMVATTFVDVLVFHQPLTPRVVFHELTHMIQYEKLGLAEFASKYVRGFLNGGSYEAIPLEMNAYELETRFISDPDNVFSVDAEVQQRIDKNRF